MIARNSPITFDGTTATVALFAQSENSTMTVDPATVAAVVGAAIDFLKDGQTDDWQRSVGNKLNSILSKLEEIITLLNKATYEIIRNNNENWQDFFASNIVGPGRAWEYYAQNKKGLSEREFEIIVAAFLNRLAPAVQAITMHDRYRSWGFTLVEIVRVAFTFSLLAQKLSGLKLSALTVNAEVVQHVLKYLKRSISTEESEYDSFAHHLNKRRLSYVEHVANMEGWCNGWVRISKKRTRHSGRAGSDESDLIIYDQVLVAHISGGAASPAITEVAMVSEYDPLFNSKHYPAWPGNIGADEREKAVYWCNEAIAQAVSRRDELVQFIHLLERTIQIISSDIAKIETWMKQS